MKKLLVAGFVLLGLSSLFMTACGKEQAAGSTHLTVQETSSSPPSSGAVAPVVEGATVSTAGGVVQQETRRVRIISGNLRALEGGEYKIVDTFQEPEGDIVTVETSVSVRIGDNLQSAPSFKEVQGSNFRWVHEVFKGDALQLRLEDVYPPLTHAFTYRTAEFIGDKLAITTPDQPMGQLVIEEFTAEGVVRAHVRRVGAYSVKFAIDGNGDGRIDEASEETRVQIQASDRRLEVVSPPFRSRMKAALFRVAVEDSEAKGVAVGSGTWVFGGGADFPKDSTIQPDWTALNLLGIRFRTISSQTAYTLPNPFRNIATSSAEGGVSEREIVVWAPEEGASSP
jgi:hypothetical protein